MYSVSVVKIHEGRIYQTFIHVAGMYKGGKSGVMEMSWNEIK